MIFVDETKQRIAIKFNRNRSPRASYVEAQTINDHGLMKMQGLVLHSFIDELIDPEKFAAVVKSRQEISKLNPTLITELEDGMHQSGSEVKTIQIANSSTSKSYATINGVQHEINSLEELEKLLK